VSQHVSGAMTQTARYDYGEFLNVMGFRIRKDLILGYAIGGPIPDKSEEKAWSINILTASGWNSSLPHSRSECEAAIERLDWIYDKDYRGGDKK
jgi:hypothetical protein